MGKCYFSLDWTQKEYDNDWLLPDPKSKLSAKCAVCVKAFDVSNTSRVPNAAIYYKFFSNIFVNKKLMTLALLKNNLDHIAPFFQ